MNYSECMYACVEAGCQMNGFCKGEELAWGEYVTGRLIFKFSSVRSVLFCDGIQALNKICEEILIPMHCIVRHIIYVLQAFKTNLILTG